MSCASVLLRSCSAVYVCTLPEVPLPAWPASATRHHMYDDDNMPKQLAFGCYACIGCSCRRCKNNRCIRYLPAHWK